MPALIAVPAISILITACGGGGDDHTLSSNNPGNNNPSTPALTNTSAEMLPYGLGITPQAIPGAVQQLLNPHIAANPNWVVSEAVKAQLSPDDNTLAVITAGYNTLYNTGTEVVDTASSTQYIFIYDVSGANKSNPKFIQAIPQINAFVGLAWNGNTTLYGTGGADDKVYVYSRASTAPSAQFSQTAAIALGHAAGIGLGVQPNAGGLAVSSDGKTLLVANNYNDSVSVIDATANKLLTEYDLRPYHTSGAEGVAGGEYPWAVTMTSGNIAFISSVRDREVVVLNLSNPGSPQFVKRITLGGNAYGMTLSPDQSQLFVAEENTDRVAVIDTKSYQITQTVDLSVANSTGQGNYSGRDTVAVTVSPDGKTLYAVNNGDNSVAVVPLTGTNAYKVAGYMPTAYAPKDLALSSDGSQMYIINGKSNTGPNPDYNKLGGNYSNNQYQFGLEQASLVSAPVPSSGVLAELTTLVNGNNYAAQETDSDAQTMQFMRSHIKHVIYVIKENRTFDQVLGDLNNGSNGDPTLTMYGKAITPNLHAVASTFATIDNFMDPGDGSMDGWSWAQHAHITPTEELSQQINYAGVSRGMAYESEGANRGIPVGLDTPSSRDTATAGGNGYSTNAMLAAEAGGVANVLPGIADVSVPDAPFGYQQDSIYSAVLQAGGSIRDYGGMVNNIGSYGTAANPLSNPYAAGMVMAIPLKPDFVNRTDTYYLGFDQSYPDTYREIEWNREFQQYVSNGQLPTFELVRMGADHTGNYYNPSTGSGNIGQMAAPEQEEADNDFAVGKLVEAVAHSPYASNTLIVIIEDDSQDGSDHVDSHRATMYFVGPYVKQGKVVSTAYNQVNAIRTIEDVLGTQHINMNTAYARPMADVFDTTMNGSWTFTTVASTILQNTNVGNIATNSAANGGLGAQYALGKVVRPRHNGVYWAKVQRQLEKRGYTLAKADRIPPVIFNEVLWKGVMGNKPYPMPHSIYTVAQNTLGKVDSDGDDD
ncbi:MAG: beta-propeller fold lactonase family protein [Burkholderiaceae bacterium]|nr:beta-propeller fold lactonase family protein [Burkholderiaceae bacterium]